VTQAAIQPSAAHSRTVTWEDPAATRAAAAGLSGLEVMRGIRDKTLAPPPMAAVIGFDCVRAEPGDIVMELIPDPSLENAIGVLHGAVAATLLDTAMGAAINTLLDADKTVVTIDLKITYLKPLTLKSAPIRASAKVLNQSRSLAYVEGEVRDASGRLAAHAVGNFSILSVGSGAAT
jgi:uncharacterized protein (TIGR00369 family)